MQRYFIYFSYDGTSYHGWQQQPNSHSVQAELQKALSTILREPIVVVGAGRTDTGVHARQMVAHFDIEAVIDGEQLAYKLNRLLPRDISVAGVKPVQADMHARFSAKWRTYHYYVHNHKNPFLRHYSCQLPFQLDYALMNQAANHLLSVTDFGAFCKTHTDVKTTLCEVGRAEWVQTGEDSWYFVIKANRFLRNMVRAVVGTLIEVGRHRMTLEQFDAVIRSGNRSNAGESMPAHALFLEEIEY